MNKELDTVRYNNKEINDLAKRIYNKYGLIFVNRLVPRGTIRKLAKKLEEYPQSEDKKLLALEYAARIKYEIMKNIDYYSVETSKDPIYYKYKENEFALSKAINDIYDIEDNMDYPIDIKRSIEKAYSDSVFYINKKKLTLNNKKEI